MHIYTTYRVPNLNNYEIIKPSPGLESGGNSRGWLRSRIVRRNTNSNPCSAATDGSADEATRPGRRGNQGANGSSAAAADGSADQSASVR